MNARVFALLLAACGSGSSNDDAGAGSDAGGDAAVGFLMPAPITNVSANSTDLPLAYGLARAYDGGTLFGRTWTTTPQVTFVVIFSSTAIDCTTDFTTTSPVSASPAQFLYPFFVSSSIGAKALVIGTGQIDDAGPGSGSSGQLSALDAHITYSSPTAISGNVDWTGWVGYFTVPVCP